MREQKSQDTPQLLFNGVDVPIDPGFTWKFKLGAYPNLVNYKCPYTQAGKIYSEAIKKKNWRKVTRKYTGDTSRTYYPGLNVVGKYMINFHKFDYGIKLLLVEKMHNDVTDSTLQITDTRFMFSNVIVRGYFNMTMDINDYEVMKEVDESKDINDADEIEFKPEFIDRYLLPQKAYLPESINQVTKKPWFAWEMIDYLMKKNCPDWWGGFWKWSGKDMKTVNKPDWNDCAPNNQVFQGTPLTNALSKLLALSRSNACVWTDGKFYVFDNADQEIVKRLENLPFDYSELTVGKSKIHKSFNVNKRSQKYRCEFDTEVEVPFYFNMSASGASTNDETKAKMIAVESSNVLIKKGLEKFKVSGAEAKLIEEGLALGPKKAAVTGKSSGMSKNEYTTSGNLINVMNLPFGITINKVRYEAGTWIDIFEVFDYYGFSFKVPMRVWYEGRYRGLFAMAYIRKKKGLGESTWSNAEMLMKEDSEFQALVNGIEEHFLTTFMIKPEIRAKMLSYNLQRAGIAQIISGKKVFSPAWLNWIDIKSSKAWIDKKLKKGTPWTTQANKNYQNMSLAAIMQTSPTSFIPMRHGGNVGIFKMSYATDARRYHYKCEPGSLKKEPPEGLKDGMETVSQWEKADWFKLVVLVTVQWLNPVGRDFAKDGNYILETGAVLGGNAPTIELYCNDMPARFTWRNTMSDPKDIVQSSPINKEQLKLYAAAHVNIKEFINADWYVGAQEFRGCDKTLKPFGNCELSVKFGKTISTGMRMSPPQPPSVYQAMSYDNRRWLAGEDVRNDFGG